jgi:hypothetical protein
MELGQEVSIKNEGLVGIASDFKHGLVKVRFSNGKTRWVAENKLRPFDRNKVNSYSEVTKDERIFKLKQMLDEANNRFAKLAIRIEGIEKMKVEAEQHKNDFAKGVAFAYGNVIDLLND